MGRHLKPLFIETLKSESRLHEVDIYLDRNTKRFFCEMPGDDRQDADSIEEMRQKARQLVDGAKPMEWSPIILVWSDESYDEERKGFGRSNSEHQQGARVILFFRRLEISPRPNRESFLRGRRGNYESLPENRAGYLEREHPIDFEAGKPGKEDRRRRENNTEKYDPYRADKTQRELRYDQATWDGLVLFKKSIDDAHRRLQAMIGLRDLSKRLQGLEVATMAPFLLPESR